MSAKGLHGIFEESIGSRSLNEGMEMKTVQTTIW